MGLCVPEGESRGFNRSHLAEVRGSSAPVAKSVLEREDVREGPGSRGMPENLQALSRFAQAHAFRGVGLDCKWQ